MTDRLLKVWLPGAASCLLFFGFYFVLSLLPFLNDRFWFISIPYLVLPLLGALAAYLSLRMKVLSLSASCPHCSPSLHLSPCSP